MKVKLLLLWMLGACAVCSLQAALADSTSLTFGVHPWPEDIAVAHLWKRLLDKRGYHVKLMAGSKAPIWAAVAKGDVDLDFESWLPHADAYYYRRFKSNITLIRPPWFKHATLGLVVPDYVHLRTVAQLKAHAKEFASGGAPTIVGISAGSSLMSLTRKAIKAYGLPFSLETSSSAAMMAALAKAYKHKTPIVVTLWAPHWAWAAYKLHYLEDPKGIFGTPGHMDHIYIFAHKGFEKAHPKVAMWLSHFQLNSPQIAQLMNIIRQSKSTDAGVEAWMGMHSKLIRSWFNSTS